jgi:teichuronic acid biosynthesis glycosyltransferase TuaH
MKDRQKRKRVLYVMHVDWRWIKQRPHFLAETLHDRMHVLVLYRFSFKRRELTDNPTDVRKLFLLPLPGRWVASRFAVLFQSAWVWLVYLFFRPDVVWLTFPDLFALLPRSARNGCLVYDCMDDVLEFPAGASTRSRLAELESQLVEASKVVLCSSDHLLNTTRMRHCLSGRKKIGVVRNACSAQIAAASAGLPGARCTGEHRPLKVAYVGTVAPWVDIDVLIQMLRDVDEIEFHLIGPMEEARRVSEPRLHFHAPVKHHELGQAVSGYDAFIMPFKVISLIEGVDPVKLYEYVAWGKEIFSIYYAEIARYETLVHFYRSADELLALLRDFTGKRLRSKNLAAPRARFLADNTWKARALQACAIIDECC